MEKFGCGSRDGINSESGPKMKKIRIRNIHPGSATPALRRYNFLKIFLFQLFGEDDPDQNVSPDTEDPEAAGDQAGEVAAQREANGVSAVHTMKLYIRRGGRGREWYGALSDWGPSMC
jgi:hypothetical protein